MSLQQYHGPSAKVAVGTSFIESLVLTDIFGGGVLSPITGIKRRAKIPLGINISSVELRTFFLALNTKIECEIAEQQSPSGCEYDCPGYPSRLPKIQVQEILYWREI